MPGLLVIAAAAVLLASGPQGTPQPSEPAAAGQPAMLTLEIRAFNAGEDVTSQTRLTVHRAGERSEAIPHARSGDGRVTLQVPAGIYDVQAIHERDGRVVNIRWANRLVVMPYPDEGGHHLEVINFKNGFGALQVRGTTGSSFETSLFSAGKRDKPAAPPIVSAGYHLYVVPAGLYDMQTRAHGKTNWLTNLEVPLDRTRLTVVE
jgi:hypothetical protein